MLRFFRKYNKHILVIGGCLLMVAHVADRPVAMVLLNAFGTRTPVGDAARIKRWLATGSGGPVAAPARRYERRISAQLD